MAEGGTPTVREYMTRDVSTVAPGDTVAEVARRIAESDGHGGFPVCDDRRVEGFVSARDLLLADDDAPMRAVMTEDALVAHPDMELQDAGRVILRSGIQKLPVVDDDGELVGIVSNADVIRSQIERATPDKVDKLTRTLETIHGVTADVERREVDLGSLRPTQDTVYADELEGRTYELRRGLAEPLVVVDPAGDRPGGSTDDEGDPSPDGPGDLLLVDGHHRAKAARRLGVDRTDAYVIVLSEPVDLGMVRTDLGDVDDVEVVDYARHPLVERTERLQEE